MRDHKAFFATFSSNWQETRGQQYQFVEGQYQYLQRAKVNTQYQYQYSRVLEVNTQYQYQYSRVHEVNTQYQYQYLFCQKVNTNTNTGPKSYTSTLLPTLYY